MSNCHFFHLVTEVSPLLVNEVVEDSKFIPASLSVLVFLFDWLEILLKHGCTT